MTKNFTPFTPKVGDAVYPNCNIRSIGLHSKQKHIVTEVAKLEAGQYAPDSRFLMSAADVEGDGFYWIKTDRLDDWYRLFRFRPAKEQSR